MKFVLLLRNQSSLYGFRISSGIQTLSKPHTNIEGHACGLHEKEYKVHTNLIQSNFRLCLYDFQI